MEADTALFFWYMLVGLSSYLFFRIFATRFCDGAGRWLWPLIGALVWPLSMPCIALMIVWDTKFRI